MLGSVKRPGVSNSSCASRRERWRGSLVASKRTAGVRAKLSASVPRWLAPPSLRPRAPDRSGMLAVLSSACSPERALRAHDPRDEAAPRSQCLDDKRATKTPSSAGPFRPITDCPIWGDLWVCAWRLQRPLKQDRSVSRVGPLGVLTAWRQSYITKSRRRTWICSTRSHSHLSTPLPPALLYPSPLARYLIKERMPFRPASSAQRGHQDAPPPLPARAGSGQKLGMNPRRLHHRRPSG